MGGQGTGVEEEAQAVGRPGGIHTFFFAQVGPPTILSAQTQENFKGGDHGYLHTAGFELRCTTLGWTSWEAKGRSAHKAFAACPLRLAAMLSAV